MQVKLFSYGHTICSPTWGFSTEGENFHRLYYIIGGSCTCTIEGHSFLLQKNHLYLMPLHVPYSMSQDLAHPLHVLWQHIALPGVSTGSHLICRKVSEYSAVWHILCAMREISSGMLVEEIKEENEGVANQIESLCASLLVVMEQQQPLFSALDPRLVQCIQVVTENSKEIYSVQNLADIAKLERSAFSRLFQKQLHISPQTFLIRRRLEYAAQLLLQGSTVVEAAERSGYADPKAFSRAFSHQYGITPTKYKKYHVLQP